MNAFLQILDLCQQYKVGKVFWPSSIGVFGPDSPKDNTPQFTLMNPTTVYGITKLCGERWCEYYFLKHGLDIRSVRYPGLISYQTEPGGGTTDYAVDIYRQALSHKHYTCFLKEDSRLPMMYMEDALLATISIMETEKERLRVRSSYNLAAASFTPGEIAANIQRSIPEFTIDYKPDFRQQIADSWPASIDDRFAREDWDWKHKYDLSIITDEMLSNLKQAGFEHEPA